jgi:hypothetical protein
MQPVMAHSSNADLPLFAAAAMRSPEPVNPRSLGVEALGEEAAAIWRVLDRDCRGIENACTAATLGLRAGIKVESSVGNRGRHVRDLIAANLEHFPEPVVSMTGDPAGFYIPRDPGEMSRGHVVLHSRMREQVARDQALARQGRAQGWEYLGKGKWA